MTTNNTLALIHALFRGRETGARIELLAPTSSEVTAPMTAAQSQSPTRWDRFVVRHSKTTNLLIHIPSLCMFFGCPILALTTGQPWWLAGFFASGLVGAFGHWVSGDGSVSFREATVELTVPYYVPLIYWKILRGQYFSVDVPQARVRIAKEETKKSRA